MDKAKLQSEIDTCVDRLDWWHHELVLAANQHDKAGVLFTAQRLVWWQNKLEARQALLKEAA